MKNKHIDLHLLVCLEALLNEQSVTRAAEKMGMSQPGMSNALARLRQLTGDMLLVRTSQGMALTPRGRELAGTVRKGLSVMEEIFADRQPFDPAQAKGVGDAGSQADAGAGAAGARCVRGHAPA
jgi:DNA-binding transcriptional LysR family regulator